MADEQDRLRRQLGLAPLPTGRTDSAASVDERTQAKAKTLTADQLEARQAQNVAATDLAAAKKANEDLAKQLGTTVDPNTGKVIPKGPTGPTGPGATGPTGPTGPGATGPTGPTGPGGAPTIVSTYTDSETGDVIAVYSDGTTKVLSKGTRAAEAALAAKNAAEDKRRKGQSAFDLLRSEFDRYGMGALVDPLKGFIQDGLSRDELTLQLRASKPYQDRFAANAKRIAAGFAAIDEATYIGLEDKYQSIFQNYGLPPSYYEKGYLGVQKGFEDLIGGNVDPVTLEERIIEGQKVTKGAQSIIDTAKKFFPNLTDGDFLGYVLNTKNGLADIKRKVASIEIGAGAMQAGLTTDLARAEELQRAGVTKETAQQGFGVIADGLERGRQLSNIYQQPDYTQQVAETEVFGLTGKTEAKKQRNKLARLETATFGGTSGAAGGALSRERAGQY
jgi:hypothetical protein